MLALAASLLISTNLRVHAEYVLFYRFKNFLAEVTALLISSVFDFEDHRSDFVKRKGRIIESGIEQQLLPGL